MANRYWVGGSGIWDGTNTANWSATSGGAGGASVPTDVDDVFFDTGATNFVVSIRVLEAICKNITVSISTAGRLTFKDDLGVVSHIQCYGTAAINAATTIDSTYPVGIYFYAASGAISVSTNNVRFYALSFGYGGGSTATFTLNSGLTAQNLELVSGTLNTNGQTVTLTTQYYYAISTVCRFYISGSDTKTLTLGNSAINIGTSALEWAGGTANFDLESGGATGLTLNANTSVITIGSTNTTNWNNSNLYGGNFTFATVVLNGNYSNITGANTFATRLAKNAVFNESILKLYANQTLNSAHTLQLIGTAAARLLVLSDEARTQRTFTLLGTTGTRTLSYVSFMDIVMSFGSSLTGTSVGDMFNNSGITFTAAVTRYAVLGSSPTSKNFSSTTAWSTSSGGATGASIPLPQDTVVFDANSGTGDIVFDTLYLGSTITATGFVGTTTVGYGPQYVLGQVTNAPANFFPTNVVFRFNSNINLPSGLTVNVAIDGGSATATMSSSLNLGSSNGIDILSGNFSTNSYNVTAGYLRSSAYSISGPNQNRSLFTVTTYTFGSSLLTLSSTLPITFQTGDTVNANTSTVEFTSTSTSILGIAPSLASKTLYNLKLTPGSAAVIYAGLSGATFNNITLSAHTSLVKISLTQGTTTTVGSLDINGTKGAGVIIGASLTLTSAVSSNATLAIGSDVLTEYVAFLGITKSGASTLSARGAADLGANTGISFQQHSVIAFSGSGATSFTVPGNFTGSSYMLVLGAGGGAGKRNASNVSAGGGGSGAIALATNLNISAGQTIYLNSPTGGAGATTSGAGGSPANAWINIAANSQPTLLTNGAYADSGNGSAGVGSSNGGTAGSTSSSLGQLEFAGTSGISGAGSTSSSSYGRGGAGGSSGNLIFRTAKDGGSGSSNGGGGGGSIQNAGVNGQNFGNNGGAGGAVGANPGGTAGVGGASPTAGGNGTAGTGVGGGGGGGSNTAGVNSGAGGNGATGSEWTYNSLNGVAGSGSVGYGGGGGGGGGISNTGLNNSAGGAGGNGGIGAGGAGGGRGSTTGGATGNGGNGGASMILFVYVEARGGNFATIIG